MNSQILNKLVAAARQLQLQSAALSKGYYYSSLSLCLVDSIFSIGVRYAAVERVVARVVKQTNIEPDRRKIGYDPLPLNLFVEAAKEADQATLFQNLQRTSSRGGILKSDAVVLAAQSLIDARILTLQDFQSSPDGMLKNAERSFRTVKGQKSGISWLYLRMLAGDDGQVKPDRHILRFIKKATDLEVNSDEAVMLIQETSACLKADFSNMTPRLLDHEIWKSESGK